MPKGKPWTKENELKLKELVEAGMPLKVIAAEFGKSVGAVREKARRLGLEVVVRRGGRVTTTTYDIPDGLPSVEEVLKVLVRVLRALDQPGLDMVEVQRLQAMVATIKSYKGLLADYVNYREIERKVLELEAKYVRLVQEGRKKG